MKTNPIHLPSNTPVRPGVGCWLTAWLILLALALALAPRAARAALAAPGDYMTYQGFLVDATGTPLATNLPANYPVVFRIFTNSTTPTAIWGEQQVVTVDRGQFSVVLGEGTTNPGDSHAPLSTIFTNSSASDRYIGISVQIGQNYFDILPRLRLVSSPYAFLASSANKLINVTNGTAYVNFNGTSNRTEVAGNLYASGVISGNGSGLTGLTAAQIPALSAASITSGTLADARLSANVALRAGGNTFTGNQIVNSGSLGIGVSPGFPLSFASTYGDKIGLYGLSGVHYGFGVQPNLFQIHSDVSGSDIAFGYGFSASFTETMRIKGTGNVGIGTANPTSKLHVVGNANVVGNLNVTGSLTVGTNNLTPVGSTETLQIIRGRISSTGTNILAGTGFTVTKVGTGSYRVEIANTFSAVPVVTVNPVKQKYTTVDMDVGMTAGGTVARCDFIFWRFDKPSGDFLPADAEFSFIAVGPR